jgi:autotransporter-associated beta strand protein
LNNFNNTIGNLLSDGSGLSQVSLGTGNLTVGNGVTPLNSNYGGQITGTGELTLQGPGNFVLSGSTNNYSGLTTIAGATLIAGANQSFSPNSVVTISGGGVLNYSTYSVTILGLTGAGLVTGSSGGVLSLGGVSESMTYGGIITGSGGLVKTGTGTLTLSASGSSYTGPTTLIGGQIEAGAVDAFSGASSVTLNPGAILNLNGFNNAVGGLSGTGGTVVLDGATLTFGAAGVNSAYAGDITGPGNLIKVGDALQNLSGTCAADTTTVVGGSLAINGTLTCPTVTVELNAFLKGAGTILGSVVVQEGGTLAPGNSIGTLGVANATFLPGSTYQVEFNATSADLLNATGSVTIDSGVTLSLVPDTVSLLQNTTYTIIQAGGGVTGEFTTVTDMTAPALRARVVYTPLTVDLVVNLLPLSSVATSGNAKAVGKSLANVFPPAGSDLSNIINQLYLAPTVKELNYDLLQMQPSQYTGLSLSQENNTSRIQIAIPNALTKICQFELCKNEKPCRIREWNVWGDGFADIASQSGDSENPGYYGTTGAVLAGFDYEIAEQVYVGLGGAYTYTHLDWDQSRGSGNINSYYGFLYATWEGPYMFVDGSVATAYTRYNAERKIKFAIFDRTASSRFSGNEYAMHVDMGGKFDWNEVEIVPYGFSDFMTVHQSGFEEKGADAFNLIGSGKRANLLRWGAGVEILRCFSYEGFKLIPQGGLSVLRESRFQGKHLTSRLKQTPNEFTVSGLNPSRTLIAPSLSLTTILWCDKLSITAEYEGEFGKHYWTQMFNLQVSCAY